MSLRGVHSWSPREDLRSGARFLRRNPAFTTVALLTLALGIGVNTAMFSATYAIILRQLPYPHASQLVSIRTRRQGASATAYFQALSMPLVDDLMAEAEGFAQIARDVPYVFSLTGRPGPDSLDGMQVSGEWFAAYGVAPLLGRPILPADTDPAHAQVAVLSDTLWRRDFGADPAIVGRTIELASQPAMAFTPFSAAPKRYIVIGVMPPHPRFPVEGDLWMPLAHGSNRWMPSPRAARGVEVVARLHADVTVAHANEMLHTVALRLGAQYPDTDRGWT